LVELPISGTGFLFQYLKAAVYQPAPLFISLIKDGMRAPMILPAGAKVL
jgi:hypothetical protein